MDVLDIARWQFGITTVYHFLMVPLTIGLGILVAVMHTMWVRTDKPEWLRMTRFWGRIYLINFVLGVATGLVQEFQFGLAWSEYSRFVGDVFGSLLAHGGAARVLPRVDVPGPVDLRLGPDPEEGAPGRALGGGDRLDRQRVLHHRGQLVDAAPGRRRHGRRRPASRG